MVVGSASARLNHPPFFRTSRNDPQKKNWEKTMSNDTLQDDNSDNTREE